MISARGDSRTNSSYVFTPQKFSRVFPHKTINRERVNRARTDFERPRQDMIERQYCGERCRTQLKGLAYCERLPLSLSLSCERVPSAWWKGRRGRGAQKFRRLARPRARLIFHARRFSLAVTRGERVTWGDNDLTSARD